MTLISTLPQPGRAGVDVVATPSHARRSRSRRRGSGGIELISRAFMAFCAALMLCIGPVATAANDSFKHFEIKAEPLAEALMEFGAQSGLTVVAPTTLTTGKNAPALHGDLAWTDALGRLLNGSGLSSRRVPTARSLFKRPAAQHQRRRARKHPIRTRVSSLTSS